MSNRLNSIEYQCILYFLFVIDIIYIYQSNYKCSNVCTLGDNGKWSTLSTSRPQWFFGGRGRHIINKYHHHHHHHHRRIHNILKLNIISTLTGMTKYCIEGAYIPGQIVVPYTIYVPTVLFHLSWLTRSLATITFNVQLVIHLSGRVHQTHTHTHTLIRFVDVWE